MDASILYMTNTSSTPSNINTSISINQKRIDTEMELMTGQFTFRKDSEKSPSRIEDSTASPKKFKFRKKPKK
jgi:hypothetical protein